MKIDEDHMIETGTSKLKNLFIDSKFVSFE